MAIDAANDKIRHLENMYEELKEELREDHRENRILKQEKTEALKDIERLTNDLVLEKREGEKLRRNWPQRETGGSSSKSKRIEDRPPHVTRTVGVSQPPSSYVLNPLKTSNPHPQASTPSPTPEETYHRHPI